MHGLDVARRARRIGERLAQVTDAARQRRLAHDRVAPDRAEQIVLGDESSGVREQVAEDCERLRGELQPTLPAPRALVVRFDANRRRAIWSRLSHGILWPLAISREAPE